MMIIGIIIIATMITVTGDITTVTNHLLGITEDEKMLLWFSASINSRTNNFAIKTSFLLCGNVMDNICDIFFILFWIKFD